MFSDLPEQDLARLIMPTWRALLSIESDRSAEHGLSHWHYIVLADVHDHPRTSQKDLAQRISRSPSRVTEDIEQLCSRKLIGRSSPQPDRRFNALTLTASGTSLVGQVRQEIRAEEDNVLRRLTDREKAQLRQLLSRALDPGTL